MAEGVINLLKPPAMSSHDAVNFARKVLGQRRVGHTGTLDPFAAGVLPLCVGRATRLVEYLMDLDKCYLARVRLGVATDSHDITGHIESVKDTTQVSLERVESALDMLAKQTEQVPPRFSALRVDGERGYQRARKGEEFTLEARPVRIYSVRLIEFSLTPHPILHMEVTCGKGTYIRSMARDLGDFLGTGAVLTHLLRTYCGHFRLEAAHTLEEVAARKDKTVVKPAQALTHLPSVPVSWDQKEQVARGGKCPSLELDINATGPLCLVDPAGDLVAVAGYSRHDGLRLKKVFA